MGVILVILLVFFGLGIAFWLFAGFIHNQDVQWVRALPEIIYYGTLITLIVGFGLLVFFLVRRSQVRNRQNGMG